jgi:hypothetical protein
LVKFFLSGYQRTVYLFWPERQPSSKESSRYRPAHMLSKTNLVVPQLYQMMSKQRMPNITYGYTAQRKTISIDESFEKAGMLDMMKRILTARTQMMQSIYIFRFKLVRISTSKVIYAARYSTRVQELQHVTNAQVPSECTVMHRVYIVV